MKRVASVVYNKKRTVLLVEQDLELVGEVVVERAVHALHRLLLRQLPVHPRAAVYKTDVGTNSVYSIPYIRYQ